MEVFGTEGESVVVHTDAIVTRVTPLPLIIGNDVWSKLRASANFWVKPTIIGQVPNLAEIAKPFTELTKKNRRFDWTPEHTEAFNRLKDELSKNTVLAHFNPQLDTELRCDASDVGVGALLVQRHGQDWRIVCCAGRCLTDTEKRYPVGERELLAIVYGLKRYRCYLYGMEFVVATDHVNHRSLLTKSDPSPRVARWLLYCMEFKFKIVYKPGEQNKDADEISRHLVFPAEELEPTEILSLAAVRHKVIDNPINTLEELMTDRSPLDMVTEQQLDPILSEILNHIENRLVVSNKQLKKISSLRLSEICSIEW